MQAKAGVAGAAQSLDQFLRFSVELEQVAPEFRLLAACAQLSQAELTARCTSFFPSLKATLNHILTVDWYYLEIFERSFAGLPPHEHPWRHFEPEEPFETCAEIAREQHAADRRLIAFCDTLDDSSLDTTVRMRRSQGMVLDRACRILAHLFQHDIHHRGQVHAMLAGTPVEPKTTRAVGCILSDLLK